MGQMGLGWAVTNQPALFFVVVVFSLTESRSKWRNPIHYDFRDWIEPWLVILVLCRLQSQFASDHQSILSRLIFFVKVCLGSRRSVTQSLFVASLISFVQCPYAIGLSHRLRSSSSSLELCALACALASRLSLVHLWLCALISCLSPLCIWSALVLSDLCCEWSWTTKKKKTRSRAGPFTRSPSLSYIGPFINGSTCDRSVYLKIMTGRPV